MCVHVCVFDVYLVCLKLSSRFAEEINIAGKGLDMAATYRILFLNEKCVLSFYTATCHPILQDPWPHTLLKCLRIKYSVVFLLYPLASLQSCRWILLLKSSFLKYCRVVTVIEIIAVSREPSSFWCSIFFVRSKIQVYQKLFLEYLKSSLPKQLKNEVICFASKRRDAKGDYLSLVEMKSVGHVTAA